MEGLSVRCLARNLNIMTSFSPTPGYAPSQGLGGLEERNMELPTRFGTRRQAVNGKTILVPMYVCCSADQETTRQWLTDRIDEAPVNSQPISLSPPTRTSDELSTREPPHFNQLFGHQSLRLSPPRMRANRNTSLSILGFATASTRPILAEETTIRGPCSDATAPRAAGSNDRKLGASPPPTTAQMPGWPA